MTHTGIATTFIQAVAAGTAEEILDTLDSPSSVSSPSGSPSG